MMLRAWRPVLAPALVVWVMASALTAVLHLSNGDLGEYHRYALAFLHPHGGARLPAEYPAPALLVFLAPLLLPVPYAWGFCLLAAVALVALLRGFSGPNSGELDVPGALRLVAYLALGAVMFLTARYDLFAVAAAFLAFRAGRGGRWGAAWAWSSAGFLLKLFPAVLWPVFFLAEWRATGRMPWRRLAWAGASLALLVAVPLAVEPGAAGNAVHYYLARPSEIGSLGAGLALVSDPHAWHYVLSFHSVNAVGPLVAPMSALVSMAAVAGLAATWWAQASGRLTLEAAALCSLTLLVVGSKVFSVQYLLWLLPFWALERPRAGWIGAAVVSTAVFPLTVSAMTLGHLGAGQYLVSLTLADLLRDLLVVAGTVVWLRGMRAERVEPVHGSSVLWTAPGSEPILARGR